MKRWRKCELHTHTYESDGSQTVEELLCKGKELLGLDVIALTDHNTISGNSVLVAQRQDICCIPGIELTTFYGHFLALGVEKFVEWRKLDQDNFDEVFKQCRKSGELYGIAHPRRVGDPISTGSYFSYKIEDYSVFDYTEVWTRSNPSSHVESGLNMDFWHSLLNKGYRITGVTGRDWHRGGEEELEAYTLVLTERIDQISILEAIRNGQVQCTYGPIFQISRWKNNKWSKLDYGQVIHATYIETFSIDMHWMESELWKQDKITGFYIGVRTNRGFHRILCELPQKMMRFDLDTVGVTWFIIEAYGCYLDHHEQMLAFTNPIYI